MTLDTRFKNVEMKIGILVLVVLLSTVLSLIYVGYQKDLFAERISYKVISPTGERLVRGMPVKFHGFTMGDVAQIELNDQGNIVLTLAILKKYQKWIKSDSKVFFNQESLIGKPFLRFTAGSEDKPEMPENSEFVLEFEGGVDEIIKRAKPVMEDLKQIVENLRILSDNLSSPKGDFQMFLSSLRKTAENLNTGEGVVPYLLNNSNSREKVDSILQKIDEMGDGYRQLAVELQQATKKIDSAVVGIDKAVNLKLNPILDDISKTTKDLYHLRRKGEYTLGLGSDLLMNLNNTWPFAPSGETKEIPELPLP